MLKFRTALLRLKDQLGRTHDGFKLDEAVFYYPHKICSSCIFYPHEICTDCIFHEDMLE